MLLCVTLVAGCASTYELDKDTVVIFTFGVGLAIVREKELSGESTADADRVRVNTSYGDLEVEQDPESR